MSLNLKAEHINDAHLLNETIAQAVEMAKAAYQSSKELVLVLLSPAKEGDELVMRPDMAQFMPNTSVQIMKIATTNAIKDVFESHNAIAIGATRSEWVPAGKSFYNIVTGQILAVNPSEESLKKYGISHEAAVQQ